MALRVAQKISRRKVCVRKLSWPTLRFYLRIYILRLSKITKDPENLVSPLIFQTCTTRRKVRIGTVWANFMVSCVLSSLLAIHNTRSSSSNFPLGRNFSLAVLIFYQSSHPPTTQITLRMVVLLWCILSMNSHVTLSVLMLFTRWGRSNTHTNILWFIAPNLALVSK
jgi:hypothetical protein